MLSASHAGAAETLGVGKAVPEAFSFTPLDVGMRRPSCPRHRNRTIDPMPDTAQSLAQSLAQLPVRHTADTAFPT
jgi:hypothetical protein